MGCPRTVAWSEKYRNPLPQKAKGEQSLFAYMRRSVRPLLSRKGAPRTDLYAGGAPPHRQWRHKRDRRLLGETTGSGWAAAGFAPACPAPLCHAASACSLDVADWYSPLAVPLTSEPPSALRARPAAGAPHAHGPDRGRVAHLLQRPHRRTPHNTAGTIADNIDTCAWGGYVVGAGSTVNGHLQRERETLRAASEGRHNAALLASVRAVGRFAAWGDLPRHVVENAFQAEGELVGLTASECRATIASALDWSIRTARPRQTA